MIKTFTKLTTKLNLHLNAKWFVFLFMLVVSINGAWSANLYIYSTSSSAKAWIWVEGGSNYTGGDWNSRPALSNTTYFESLGNNIYRYKKQTLPSKVNIILTPSGGSPEARIDNLSLSSDKYLSYSGGSSITQVTRPTNRYVAGSTAGDTVGTDNVFGTRWEADGSTNKMTWDASKCLFVKEYITNEASSMTLTFKITDGTWSNSWPSSNKTQSVSSGCKITTITFNIFTNAVSSTSASSSACCVTVNTPDVSADKSAVCKGGTVTLNLNSRQDGVTYKIGNTEIFSGSTTTYEFTPTGNVSVEASHANSCDGATATKNITIRVDEPSELTFTYAETTICKGEEVTLDDFVYSHTGTVTWYNSYSYVDSNKATDVVSPTSTHKYYATAKNGECSIAEAQLNVIVNKPPVTPTLSAENDVTEIISGSTTATLVVGNTENGATYTLYKDGVSTGNTGTRFEGISQEGTYTVVGNNNNGCGDSDFSDPIDITLCEPITGLTWSITEGEKDVYCPGDEVTVTMTYNGTTAKDYDWGGEYDGNIGILGGSIASGAQYTMTIYKSGSVNLTLTDCDNKTPITPTLEFTTHETPATPTITFSVNPVGQSKETILSIASYSADNNYIVYRSADNAVGNDTEVGAYTAPMSIRHNDTGSYYYYAKATNKSCDKLTATSAIVKLDVQEAGAIIAALGDLKVDPQDPVDFVAMYVKNDGLSDFTDQGATKVTGYTWQFSNDDGNTWTDCASTNAVAGATYSIIGMENGSSKCNNFRPNAVGKYRCKVTYDEGEQTSNVLTVTGDGITARTFKDVTMTLPVISVNTGDGNFPVNDFGGTPSKNADKMKEKISVDVKIFENINGTTQVVYDRKARMNYRGSSSMNFLKKSYAFCPGDEMCGDKKGVDYVKTAKLNMLGIGNALDKDWVLYAAAADPSLMRNRLMFDTFRDMTGGWSVNSRYVELVVNGEYRGVYVMMDKITKNDNRINVKWKIDENTGETTQKGFIIKLDKTDIADRYENNGDKKTFKSKYSGHDGFDTYDTEIDQRFEIEYPEKEDIEDDGGDWSIVYNEILGMVNKFEEELAKGNFTEVQKLIDYESWADWFIITEYGKNIDGYRASNLFVFDENGKGKLEARPLWDQELSFNNQCPSYYGSYGSSSTSGLLIDKTNSAVYDNDASAPFWFTGKYKGGRGTYNGSDQTFKGLLDDPCFVAVLQSRWEKHVSGALSQKSLTDKENNYISELGNIGTNGTPMNRELKFWQNNKGRHYIDCGTGAEKSCYNGTTGYSSYNTSESITQSATDLTNWLKGDRRTNLGNIINNMEGTDLRISLTMTPANGETTPWEAVMVQVNNPSGYDYDLNYTTNTLDKVEGVIISENNDKYTYRIPRPSTWGTGDGERDAIEYGIQAILNVADDNLQCGTINEEFTKADVTITLKDEEDDDCSIVEP